jgi:hypothetical protein
MSYEFTTVELTPDTSVWTEQCRGYSFQCRETRRWEVWANGKLSHIKQCVSDDISHTYRCIAAAWPDGDYTTWKK